MAGDVPIPQMTPQVAPVGGAIAPPGTGEVAMNIPAVVPTIKTESSLMPTSAQKRAMKRKNVKEEPIINERPSKRRG
jgi:hypothetical protein